MKISKNKIMIAVIIALCAVVAGLVIYMVVGKNNKITIMIMHLHLH